MTVTQRSDRRAEIVQAAYRVLAERGYEATSIKDIARAADIAPGLIHYYFATKEELLVAVVEEASARSNALFHQLRETAKGRDLALGAFELSLSVLRDHPQEPRLRFELFAVGLHNPAVRTAVARVLEARRKNSTSIARLVGNLPDEPAEFGAVIAAALDGLAMHALADPAFDPAPAYRALTEMSRLYGEARRKKPKRKRRQRAGTMPTSRSSVPSASRRP